MNKNKIFNKVLFVLAIVIALLSFSIFIFSMIFKPTTLKDDSNSVIYDREWNYTASDGSVKSIYVSGDLDVEDYDPTRLYTVLPEKIEEGTKICMFLFCDAKVYIGDELRFVFKSSDNPLPGPLTKSVGVYVDLYESDAGKTLTLVKDSFSQYNNLLARSYIGDTHSIYTKMFSIYGPQIIFSFILMVVSILSMIISIYFKFAYDKLTPDFFLAIGVFFANCWLIFDSKMFNLIFNTLYIDGIMCFVCLLLTPFPFAFYLNIVQNRRYEKLYIVDGFIACANFIVFTILHMTDIVGYFESMLPMSIILVTTFLIPISTIFKDFLSKKVKEYPLVAFGIVVMLAASVGEAIFTNIYPDAPGLFIMPGIYFLLFMTLIYSLNQFVKLEKDRENAVNASQSKTRFLANMSHEIRTPINSVIGMNEMILRETDNPNIRNYAKQVQSSSKLLLSLVNDVLDISRIESGKMNIVEENYDSRGAFLDLINILRERAKTKGLKVNINVSEDIPRSLKGDILHIKQIVINLLSNAVKYTKEGTVSFGISSVKYGKNTTLLSFEIEDTGIGLKEENIDIIFDRFTRISDNNNSSVEGTGLGLNIVKNLSDAMGGEIFIESEYGIGSTFTFVVKQEIIDETPIDNIDEINNTFSGDDNKKMVSFIAPNAKLLVVDDNKENLYIISELLKRTMIKLDLVSSGNEGIFKCRQNKYDLILMDHMMPEPDGVECLNTIKKDKIGLNNNTPVVVLTANAVVGMKTKYLKMGFDDYLTKPVDVAQLEYCISSLLPSYYVEYVDVDESRVKSTTKDDKVTLELKKLLMMDYQKTLNRFSNDKDSVLEFLKVICKEGNNNIARLRRAVRQSDIDRYRSIVHSIKGVMATIYADDLVEMAKEHEKAAVNGDWDYINKNFLAFCNMYSGLINEIIDCISHSQIANNEKNDKIKDFEEVENNSINLKEELIALKDSINLYQQDEAEDIIERIGTFAKDKALLEMLDKVINLLEDFEYENALELVENLISQE